MAEYIERGAAKYAVDLAMDLTETEYDMVCNQIDQIHAADVAPVRHGRWVHTDWAYNWTCLDECSRCGYHDRDRKNLSDYVYCPMCGAIMDLEE